MGAVTLLIMAIVIAGFIAYFEKQSVGVEKIVIIALLSAIAIAGRVLFSMFPSVQPSSFIIIMAGMCFGGQIGMLTGIITAFSSNLILGQGPWTLPQMLCWGIMGLMSGVMGNILDRHKIFRIIYGFSWGFLFGWAMNIYFITGYDTTTGFANYIAACVLSFPFDLAHAAANAILLACAGDSFIWTFKRISVKYGIGQNKKFYLETVEIIIDNPEVF